MLLDWSEPSQTRPSRTKVSRRPRTPASRGFFARSLRASRTYLHRNPCLALGYPLWIAPAAKVSPSGLRGYRRAAWNKRRAGHQEVGARDTLGRGGARARAGAARERAGGGPRRAPPSGCARRSACAEPLRGLSDGPESPSRASTSSTEGLERPPTLTLGGRSSALCAPGLGPRCSVAEVGSLP